MSAQIVIVINRQNSVFDVFKSNKREFNFFESRIQELYHAAYLLCLENVGNSDSPTNSRNAEVASLGEHDEKKKTLILDLFVDNNSTSTLGDIENTASFAMVHLVRHSFVDGTIYLNNKKKLIYSCSRCTKKTTLNNFSHGCISRQMYTTKEKHLHVSLPYACIILPMAALALLVEHLAAERKVTCSIPRHRPILRVLKSTE